jgi:hypothetical protein
MVNFYTFIRDQESYGSVCLQTVQAGDLCIRDLGYFDLTDFQQMDERGAYYISRLKVNTCIYQKNEHPETFKNGIIKKNTEYIQLDMEHIMNQLQPGQTIEITNAYVGMYQKLPTRVIIHRLTEEQTQKRWRDQAISWQIEALFKTWKSFFQIDKCKRMKQERLECHLYGQLIGILLCSSTMFRMRQLLLNKKKRELSEYKAMYVTKDYFLLLYQSLQKNTQELSKILLRLFHLLEKNGRKSHRYEKKTVFDILGVVYQYTMGHTSYTRGYKKVLGSII